MEKRIIIFLGFIILAQFASAEILISQPNFIYNIKDALHFSITLKPSTSTNDFFIAEIVCGEDKVEIYRNQFNLPAGEETQVSINSTLSASIIGDLHGLCSLMGKYGQETATSHEFTISRDIIIDLEFQKLKFKPKEKILIIGEAKKANGQNVDGFVEARIPEINVFSSTTINDGKFNFSLNLPDNSPVGNFNLQINAYDKDYSGLIGNFGNASQPVEIVSVLKTLEITTNSLNGSSGEEITYSVIAYDQSGNNLENKEIAVTMYEPGDFIYSSKILMSGQKNTFKIESNTTPGFWRIEASTEGITSKKLFQIEERIDATFSLIENTLIVTNIGNVPFFKNVEVGIGSAKEIKQIDLKLGETKKFKLNAPEGEYLIRVNDGNKESSLGTTFLTGKAIGIDEINSASVVKNPLSWLVAAIIIVFLIIFAVKKSKFRNKKTGKKEVSKSLISSGGKKEEASVIAINFRSNASSKYSDEVINNSLAVGSSAGAKIYVSGNYRIMVFSQSLTKLKENETIAIKVSNRIREMFLEYNKKFREKIIFGIGVNSGDMIVESIGGEYKITSLGNLIIEAKRISNLSDEEVLVSESVYKRTAGAIKYEKAREKSAWKALGISDRTKHNEFLKRFKTKNG